MTTLRPLVRMLHLAATVLFGLFATAAGLSGSALVFRPELERALYEPPIVPGGSTQPMEVLRVRAMAVEPGRRISMVVLPDGITRPVQFILQKRDARTLKEADQLVIYVNPYSGAIEGTHRREGSFLGRLRDLHFAFFAGPPGLTFNGYVALALVFLAASGFVLWIQASPARQRFRLSLRGNARSIVWNLHRQAGAASFPLLIVIGLTGAYYPFRASYLAVIQATTGAVPPRGSPPVPSAAPFVRPASLDAIASAARAAFPEARLAVLRIPARDNTAWAATFHRPGDSGDSTDSGPTLHMDPFTLSVLRLDDSGAMPLGARLARWMEPVHYGKFGGLASRLAWLALGLLPLGFALSGAWMWWNRTRAAPRSSS
ncbi:MAG: PepSY domain-containing protein [Vicinamibacteria bacterium]|nr:PepSY domain-containing protein [Vicinamibacteria bacterium]